jgi:hypothetical protein
MKREDREEMIMKHEKYLKPVSYNKLISSQKNENKINEAKITFFNQGI